MAEKSGTSQANASQICPTCGTNVDADATRCPVCAADLRPEARARIHPHRGQITLSLPIALLLLALFSALSAGLTFAAVRFTPIGAQATPSATATATPTITQTPTATLTATPEPTATPLPPIEYTVAENDTCAGLAFFYNVSVRSIIELNNLGVDCPLTVGQTILIPQPTPTPTATATPTLSPAEATEAACEKVRYTVEANDTLSGIAENYRVSMQAIKEYNGMTGETVFEGQVLIIPLCERITFGATPTPTTPPPYPPPNLLLPQDGAAFTLANETVTLQWASVGELREDEYYEVNIQDITDETGQRWIVDHVKDTKYIVPSSFRPTTGVPHIMRWWVRTVRQIQSAESETPRYLAAGAESVKRVFSWTGAPPPSTPNP